MTMTAYPGVLAGFGAPYLNNSPLITAGKIFFVDSNIGRAGNVGDDSLRPLATIMQAYAKCRANKGDYVVCAPGHAETITGAAGIALTKAGVRIIGLGEGAARPTFTFSTSTAASLDVTAASNSITNCIFDGTGVDAITAMINVQASDFNFAQNRVVLANATNQAVLGILTTAAASRMRITGCRFLDVGGVTFTAGTTAAIRIVGGDEITIGGLEPPAGNVFMGAYSATVGAIQGLTTDTSNLLVAHNFIYNSTTNASAKAMVFTASSTGVFANNRLCIIGGGTAPVTFAAGQNGGGNYFSNAVGVAAATLL